MICFGNKSDLTDFKKGVCRLSKLVNKSCPATGHVFRHDTELEVGSRGVWGWACSPKHFSCVPLTSLVVYSPYDDS